MSITPIEKSSIDRKEHGALRAFLLKPLIAFLPEFYGTRTQAGIKSYSDIIQRDKTAWQIAGDKYNSPDTIYKLPGGLLISGNRIDEKIGWGRIPVGTKVFVE